MAKLFNVKIVCDLQTQNMKELNSIFSSIQFLDFCVWEFR